MSNFIGLVYATLKNEGVDTKGMSTDDAVKKYNELQKKSGGKAGEKEPTPAENRKMREPNKPTIYMGYENAKGAVRDYQTAISVTKNALKRNPGDKRLKYRLELLQRDLKHYQSILDQYE